MSSANNSSMESPVLIERRFNRSDDAEHTPLISCEIVGWLTPTIDANAVCVVPVRESQLPSAFIW